MKLCATVPTALTSAPNFISAKQLAVPTQPPRTAAYAPSLPALSPCARRVPNSITLRGVWVFRPVTRVALVAIRLWKFMVCSR